MSNEVDVRTPLDQEPGNVVRVPAQRMPVFSALLIWKRDEAAPSWQPIAAPQN
jgi:hypothetical protein